MIWVWITLIIVGGVVALALLAFIDNRLKERHQRDLMDDQDAFGFNFAGLVKKDPRDDGPELW